MDESDLSYKIIGAAIEVHRTLGPGLLESVYEEALCMELSFAGLMVERQLACPIVYKGQTLSQPLRIDLLVQKAIIVECKATVENNPLFAAQCLTYLRLSDLRLGLVINFGAKCLRDGIERVVNGI